MSLHRITVASVPFDPVTQAGALEAIAGLVSARRGGFVVTPNVDHLVLARDSEQLRDAYWRASLSLADGQPVRWMARLLGTPLPARVSGSDVVYPLMQLAAERRWRVFFVGASPAVSAEAARRLGARYPGLRIVGRDTSRWSPDDPAHDSRGGTVRRIRESGADLVVVALGCPKQELWMARHARDIIPAVALGLGGSLDFVAGAIARAPDWMARVGLEWLFRLSQEPRRLAYRYLVRDPQIVPMFAAQWLAQVSPAAVRAVRAVRLRPCEDAGLRKDGR
jgi:N-acetylglucosaminyldiphosphoundecaprenol N-acetyl-beta-D-mannosaminyltransferase